MKKVIIIGAGASGLVAANELAPYFDVLMLEQSDKIARKILASGNGRCNISNLKLEVDYFNNIPPIIKEILQGFDATTYFNNLGMEVRNIKELLYPYSLSSLTVKDMLLRNLDESKILLNQKVEHINYADNKYEIVTTDNKYYGDYVVIAVGSSASFLSGKDNIELIKDMGIKVKPLRPALVSCNTKQTYKKLKGLRVKGTVSLISNNQLLAQEIGEIQFTNYGLSGICIMQLSRYAIKGPMKIVLDVLPEITLDDYDQFIEDRIKRFGNPCFEGLYNKKFVDVVVGSHWHLKQIEFDVTSFNGVEGAQVMQGGINFDQLTTELELINYPNIYCCGEILDVDGPCGGYNLHHAFSTGKYVGEKIKEKENVTNK